MEDKEPKKVQIKIKFKTLIAVVVLIVMLLASNVFAGAMGYGNIFFAIRSMVTGEKVEGKEEILSDEDITISYKPIEITDGVKIQINRAVLKEGSSKFYFTLHNVDEKEVTLDLEYYNGIKLGLKKTTESGEIVIESDRTIDKTKELLLVVDCGKVTKYIDIDLVKCELVVTGEEGLEKISEKELKDFLSKVSVNYELSPDLAISKVSDLLDHPIAAKVAVDTINAVYDESILSLKTKKQNGVELIDGVRAFEYDTQSKNYEPITDGSDVYSAKCISVDDISCESGIYTVTYKVIFYRPAYDEDLEILPVYKSKVKVKLNSGDDAKISTFKVIEMGKNEVIKEGQEVNEDEKENKDDSKTEIENDINNNSKEDKEISKDLYDVVSKVELNLFLGKVSGVKSVDADTAIQKAEEFEVNPLTPNAINETMNAVFDSSMIKYKTRTEKGKEIIGGYSNFVYNGDKNVYEFPVTRDSFTYGKCVGMNTIEYDKKTDTYSVDYRIIYYKQSEEKKMDSLAEYINVAKVKVNTGNEAKISKLKLVEMGEDRLVKEARTQEESNNSENGISMKTIAGDYVVIMATSGGKTQIINRIFYNGIKENECKLKITDSATGIGGFTYELPGHERKTGTCVIEGNELVLNYTSFPSERIRLTKIQGSQNDYMLVQTFGKYDLTYSKGTTYNEGDWMSEPITLDDMVGTYKFVRAELVGEEVPLKDALGGANGEIQLSEKQGGYFQKNENTEKEWGTFGEVKRVIKPTFFSSEIYVHSDNKTLDFVYNGYRIIAEKIN